MTTDITCQTVRALLFELRRGDISELERTEVEEHLGKCRTCSELVGKSLDMLDEAASGDGSMWADIDSEQLFGRIRTSISTEQRSDGSDAHARLQQMFRAASADDAHDDVDLDADDLFESIAGQLDTDDTTQSLEVSNHGDGRDESTAPDDTNTTPNQGQPNQRRWRRWAALCAAAITAIFAWWALTADHTDPPTQMSEVTSANSEHDSPSVAIIEPLSPTPSELVEESPTDDAPPSLATQPLLPMEDSNLEHQSLQLFASDDADYEISHDNGESTIDLHNGSILVEYLPHSMDQLAVHTPTKTITVTGTVFSVRVANDDFVVAVFEGGVRLDSPDGTSQEITTGEFASRDHRGQWPDALGLEVERYVELESHRKRLRQLEAQSDASEPSSQTDTSETEPQPEDSAKPTAPDRDIDSPAATEPDDIAPDDTKVDSSDEPEEIPDESPPGLRQQALQALHGGEHRRAVDLLNQALEETASDDPINADILLELAQIHLRQLDEPRRAADYLRRLLAQWPDDPAADTVRRHLCDDDALGSADDPLCEP